MLRQQGANRAGIRGLVFLMSMILVAEASGFSSRGPQSINWKLFFAQMFALELQKEASGRGLSQAQFQEMLREHVAYNPKSVSEIVDFVSRAETSAEAYRLRQQIYDDPANYSRITSFNLAQTVPAALMQQPAVQKYLREIENNKNRAISDKENFFNSPEGKNFVQAISTNNGGSGQQEVALILVPGYAAHTIKFDIFPEMLSDMNRYWQRANSRPILDEGNGIDITYEKHDVFYGRSESTPKPFDILTPAGWEMGNTVGLNSETADLLAEWIDQLPPSYRHKKLILLGYSKGAPVILELLQRHPRLKSRLLGFVSFAGVVQGTNIARDAKVMIDGVLGARTIGDVIKKVREKGGGEALATLAPFLSGFDLSFTKIPAIKEVMETYGIDADKLEEQADRLLNGREIKELLDGVVDLSPYTRSVWNLKYLDNQLVNPGTFMFNVSAVTDISSFASNIISTAQRHRSNALIAPRFYGNNKIDWQNFSLDAWFLYLSSIGGFKLAPGGLYDTQVDLQHTKSPWVDGSPLANTLTGQELADLWNNSGLRSKLQQNGIASLSQLATSPRNRILRPETISNLNSFDLGEFKGHHWSLFLQAFRPSAEESEVFFQWNFPRKAFMRALLQTLALYNLAGM